MSAVVLDVKGLSVAFGGVQAVDGLVLVVRPGYTRKDALRALKEEIKKLRLKNVVAVLNRVPRRESYYSKYYPYNYEKPSKSKA